MNKIVHKNISIYGRVQGVGFRFAARNAANAFGIKGFVKNMSDGSVYIEAEGSEFRIAGFLNWCGKGPSHAQVEDVVVEDSDIKGFHFFDISHENW